MIWFWKTTFKSISGFTTTYHFRAIKGEEIILKKGVGIREKKENKYIEIKRIPII